MHYKQIAFRAWGWMKHNAGKILTGTSIAGLIGTGILSAKGATKVWEGLDAHNLSDKDEVRLYIRSYAPAVAVGLGTAASIIGIEVLGERKAAALTAAYSLVSSNYKLYRSKNIEVNGQEADTKVLEAMESEMMEGDYGILCQGCFLDCSDDIRYKDYPRELFFEPISGVYFEACMPVFLNARYHLNRNFQLRGFASHDEFLSFLGIGPEVDPYQVDYNDDLGWDCEYLADMTGQYVIDISTKTEVQHERPVNVIDYAVEPVSHYDGNCC